MVSELYESCLVLWLFFMPTNMNAHFGSAGPVESAEFYSCFNKMCHTVSTSLLDIRFFTTEYRYLLEERNYAKAV